MHKLRGTIGKNATGRKASLALTALAAIGLAASATLDAQVPGVVFSNPYYVGAASSSGTNQDFEANIGRIAANQRGDVFFINDNFNGAVDQMVMVPAGTFKQVLVISNLTTNSQSVALDPQGNLWAMNGNYQLVFIPVTAGVYPNALDTNAITTYCSLPVATQNTAPCLVSLGNNNTIGFPAISDLQFDASGNMYALDFGDNQTGYDKVGRILKYDPATMTPKVVLDNLPAANQSGRIAVSSNGDLFEVDGTNVYYSAAGSGKASTLTSFSQPTGVSSDSGGNIYVSETGSFGGNGSITLLPNEEGKVNPADRFTIVYGTPSNTGAPAYSAGIDGFGVITFAGGGYGGDFYRTALASLSFGPESIGSYAGSQGLPMYFENATTFGSFKIVSNSGAAVPFAVTTNTCTSGTTYTAAATCTVSVDFVATAAGPQAGTLFAYDNSGNLLGTAYLSGFGLAPLLNIDPGTSDRIGSSWKEPAAITVDAAGNTYVADSLSGGIYKNGSTTAIATGFSQPSGVVVDAGGNLYVADSGNGRVVEVPISDNKYGTPVTVFTGTSGPSGLAIDSSSNLYLADSGNARVLLLGTAANLPPGSNSSPIGSGYTKPVAVAADSAGNVYISDSGTGQISQYNFARATLAPIVAGLTTAAGLAVDSGGNLFYADAGKQTITRVPNVGGTLDPSASSTLATIVTTPSAVAVDGTGNVYAADAVDASVGKLNRTSGSANFGPVVEATPSESVPATLSNGGSSSLKLGSPYETASGPDTQDFAVQSNSTCAAGVSLAAGGSCSVVSIFTPSIIGSESETLSFGSNGGNVSLFLTGTGTAVITATFTGPSTLVYGNTGTYTVKASQDGTYVVNISGSASATTSVVIKDGTGSFKLPVLGVGKYVLGLAGAIGAASLTVTPATLYATAQNASRAYGTANPIFQSTITGAVNGDTFVGSGTTAATISSNAGQYPIVPIASGSASANYTVVATDGVLTITQVQSNTVLSFPPATDLLGTPITFQATVTSSTAGVPTGTVTFENVTAANHVTPIGTATLGATGTPGLASFTTSSLASGTIYVAAVYNGDVNFVTSTSAATGLTVSLPTFTLTASPQTLQIVQGQSGTVQLTVTPVGNFTSAVTFSCQGLPLEASCAFANGSVSPNGGPVSTTLTVHTTGPTSAKLNNSAPWANTGTGLALAGGMLILWRRRRLTKGLFLIVLVSLVALIPVTGCSLNEKPFDTPLGISTVTVTASSAANTTQVTAELRLAITN
jgi:sugar lactone lactonase YvrE